MISRKSISLLCLFSFMASAVQAAPPTTPAEAQADIAADSQLVSGWVSDQFKRAIPFNSTAGDVVPKQLKIFGIEAGVEAVAPEGLAVGVVLKNVIFDDGSHITASRDETNALQHVHTSRTEREGWEDLMWALCNTTEFMSNH